jgi:hypothetical protein
MIGGMPTIISDATRMTMPQNPVTTDFHSA